MSSRKTKEVVDRGIVASCYLLGIELSFGEFSTFVFCQERGGRLAKWGQRGLLRDASTIFNFQQILRDINQHLPQKWGLLALSGATALPSDPP